MISRLYPSSTMASRSDAVKGLGILPGFGISGGVVSGSTLSGMVAASIGIDVAVAVSVVTAIILILAHSQSDYLGGWELGERE